MPENKPCLGPTQKWVKRAVDIFGASAGLLLTGWVILLAFVAASLDTRANGFFIQPRVGYRGRLFPLIKIRTMRMIEGVTTTVTTRRDPRITPLGRLFRRTKIDELPQLINILLGHMSFVGPRPDVPGFADVLEGDDRCILDVRPGITGPATLYYRNEEALLAGVDDPDRYNREVIFPNKVRLNREYIRNFSVRSDIDYIWKTILPGGGNDTQQDSTLYDSVNQASPSF